MRITPVTGDLPAVATPPPPPVRQPAAPPAAPVTAAVTQAGAASTDADATARDRPAPSLKPFFDPPLIAQRAALGLPTGFLIADLARAEGLPFCAVAAAGDRERPRSAG